MRSGAMIARRRFLELAGAATAWPLIANAQAPENTVIGLLSASYAGAEPHLADAIRRGLQQVGFVEGQNLTIEFRYADTKFDRLPALAAELVARPVAAIICSGNLAALAAKKATATIPIIFNTAGEPVAVGLLSGLNRPGSNVTGFGFFSGSLASKRLSLLREVAPKPQTIAVLLDPNSPFYASQRKETQDAARALGLKLLLLPAGNDRDIEAAFKAMDKQKSSALLVSASPYFHLGSSQPDRRPCRAHRHPGDLLPARMGDGRRADELRPGPAGNLPAGRRLHRKDPQGRAAGRPAGRTSRRTSNLRSIPAPQGRSDSMFRRACSLSPIPSSPELRLAAPRDQSQTWMRGRTQRKPSQTGWPRVQ